MTAGDSYAYEFLSNFQEVIPYLGSDLEFKVLYYSNNLEDLQMGGENDANSCIGGNTKNDLCLLTEDHSRIYLQAEVYQACIFDNTTTQEFLFWNKNYNLKCTSISSSDEYFETKLNNCNKDITKSF